LAYEADRRLAALRDRRQGITALQKSLTASPREILERAQRRELYETRSANTATRYALGSMQEVDPEYTKNSIAEGDRVKNQLARHLAGLIPVDFQYQGSVPLNVHIKGVSDVDLLVLRTDFLTIDANGRLANTYSDWTGEGPTKLLARLREKSEAALISAFPEADVVTSGAKSIAISGGSLRRKVDVVPSHWHDTAAFQASSEVKDRGVRILNKDLQQTILNLPFQHIHRVDEKDQRTNGGAKKVIRLLKNLRNDSDYKASIGLSSYEIAGLVWHFDNAGLTVYPWQDLSLIATTKQNLDALVADRSRAMALLTPDLSRFILDSEEKFRALVLLSLEVDQLAEAVANELAPHLAKANGATLRTLREAYVPS
jgi:hypothetical protein